MNTSSVPVPPTERRKHLFNFLFTAPISCVCPKWRWLQRPCLLSGPDCRFPYPMCLYLQCILLICAEWHLSTILGHVSSSDSGCSAALCCLCWFLIPKYLFLSKWKGLSWFLRPSWDTPTCGLQALCRIFLLFSLLMASKWATCLALFSTVVGCCWRRAIAFSCANALSHCIRELNIRRLPFPAFSCVLCCSIPNFMVWKPHKKCLCLT